MISAISITDMTISDKDERLIALLQEDGRMSVAEIARRLGVSRTAAQMRLHKLEGSGVITGYGVRLTQKYYRGRVKALVLIKSPPSNRDAIERALTKMPHLVTLYSVSGPFDLAAVVSAQSVEALDAFIDQIGRLEGVADTMSSVILSTKVDR